MRDLSCVLLLVFLFQPGVLAGGDAPESGIVGIAGNGDQFERAMLELIASAARDGKKIRVKRMDYNSGEGMIAIGPSSRRTTVTSVIAVEIRDPEAMEEPSQRILLKNQEEIIKALNVICEGQLESGGKLSIVAGLGSELNQSMRGVSSDVDRVNEGVSATHSEVGDVSEFTQDNARTLEGIKKELKKLNQTVQSLLSSMGEIGDEVGALASAEGEEAEVETQDGGGDVESSSEGKSTEGNDEGDSEGSPS